LVVIREGGSLTLGHVRIELRGGVLTLKDPYKVEEYRVVSSVKVSVRPEAPYRSPSSLTSCMSLSFETPIVVSARTSIRVSMPYELEVLVNGKPISVLTPFKVKYTVVGSPAEGVLCRWYPSKLIAKNEVSGEGVLEVNVESLGTELIRGILIEDVSGLPMRPTEFDRGIQVIYGPVRALCVGNHLVISQRRFQSKIIDALRTSVWGVEGG